MANQHIVKCITYEVAIVPDQLVRDGRVETVDFIRFYDPDTGEEWRFLAEPDTRPRLIEKLAEGIEGENRAAMLRRLASIEIVTVLPGGKT